MNILDNNNYYHCFILLLFIVVTHSQDSPTNDINDEKREENFDQTTVNIEQDVAGVSNIHLHLTVPRYYSPYEEVPFLYFINSTIPTYVDQEKYYFNLHMGSTPFTPTYGLLLSNLSSGSYTFQIGRAFNRTWFAFALNSIDISM